MAWQILHTNDLHGRLDEVAETVLADARKSADFYFDSGDAIRTGNVGIPLAQDPVWRAFARLKCTASTCGNREFHVTEAGFRAKLSGSKHPILVSNLTWKGDPGAPLVECADDTPLSKSLLMDGVGVVGVMVPMVTSRMAARHISRFINLDPFESVRHEVAKLRDQCELLICVSHLGLKSDSILAEKVTGIDLILGGHSHDCLNSPVRIGDTWICQGGSQARFFGSYEWDRTLKRGELIPLRST